LVATNTPTTYNSGTDRETQTANDKRPETNRNEQKRTEMNEMNEMNEMREIWKCIQFTLFNPLPSDMNNKLVNCTGCTTYQVIKTYLKGRKGISRNELNYKIVLVCTTLHFRVLGGIRLCRLCRLSRQRQWGRQQQQWGRR